MHFCYSSISQELPYTCPAMQLHHQEVSCRTQVLWYSTMLCPSVNGVMVNHHCVLYIAWNRYRAVEAVLWLGDRTWYRLLPPLCIYSMLYTVKKGKVIPLQARCGPEGG